MSKVSLKWPRMPATAMAIPAKYVKVSPTKTSDGYQLKSRRAAVVAASGSIRYSENRCPSLQSKGIQIKALTPTNREAGKESKLTAEMDSMLHGLSSRIEHLAIHK